MPKGSFKDLVYNAAKNAKKKAEEERLQAEKLSTWYHGGPEEIDGDFVVGQDTGRWIGGAPVKSQGVSLTRDKEDAKRFGENVSAFNVDVKKTLDAKSDADDLSYILDGAIQNKGAEEFIDIFGEPLRPSHLGNYDYFDEIDGWQKTLLDQQGLNWSFFDVPEVAKRMKERGYDSAMVAEPNLKSESIFVLDPKNIAKPALAVTAGAAAMQPEEAEASFIGRTAKTFNKAAEDLAIKMRDEGATRDEIWKATGEMGAPTYFGPDGKVRQEISDEGLAVKPHTEWSEENQKTRGTGRAASGELSEFMRHDELAGAYPDILGDEAKTSMNVRQGGGESASYLDNADKVIVGDVENLEGVATIQPGAAMHEIQHAIQGREGFARGGNQKEFAFPESTIDQMRQREKLEELRNYHKWMRPRKRWDEGQKKFVEEELSESAAKDLADLEEEISGLEKIIAKDNLSPFEKYKRLAGEAESRNVETRLPMTMEERIATPPWETLDIPEEELILRDIADAIAHERRRYDELDPIIEVLLQ